MGKSVKKKRYGKGKIKEYGSLNIYWGRIV